MTGPPQHEIPLGIVGVVQRGPYPIFPEKPIARIRWAMKAPIAHTSGKAVLIILAIHADEQGKAWPSLATITECGSMTRRTAISAVKRLAERGWITVERRSQLTSRYWPKSPRDKHCPGCRFILPPGAPFCPICGLEGGENISLGGEIISLGGENISPNILMNS